METLIVKQTDKFIFNNPVFTDEVKCFIESEKFKLQAVNDQFSLLFANHPMNAFVSTLDQNSSVKTFIINEGIGIIVELSKYEKPVINFWEFTKFKNFFNTYKQMSNFAFDYLNPTH